MRTFTFEMRDYDDTASFNGAKDKHTTYEFSGDDATVDDLLYHFQRFLQSCDYCFGLGDTLEVVKE